MNLLKTSILNGIAVLIKTATLFLLNKILAVYIGPNGYAMVGQYQNFIQIITTFSGNSINTAVIKYTAEYGDDKQKQHQIWKNAGTTVFIFSIFLSLSIFLLSETLAILVFGEVEYKYILNWFAFFLLFFNLNTLLIAILNGKKEISRLVIANISGSIIALALTTFLVIQYNLSGALISLSIYQSIAFFITLAICIKTDWFKLNLLFGRIQYDILKNFSSYALMALVSALCIPLSQMYIRDYIISEYSQEYAGYWEAMIRLSAGYLMLITTTLSVYYLPRLSELKTRESIKKEVFYGYKTIFPFVIIFGLTIFILRIEVIDLLFSSQFRKMETLFLWQIIGDSLKIGSWILAYLMLSKKMTKLFIITEIVFSVSYVILTLIFTYLYGFEGTSISYMVNYGVYWIVIGFYIFKKERKL